MIWSLPPQPYVGLRPFDEGESQIFFGRQDQVVALAEQLYETRFVAVVGSSGSGKSSLVRAGLIPALRGGLLARERDTWNVLTMKPGDAPITNLAAALLSLTPKGQSFNSTDLAKEVYARGNTALSGILDAIFAGKSSNMLLLVDQFEELFRYGLSSQNSEKHRAASEFVQSILALAGHSEYPIYVAATMRSDFIGECDAFLNLPEALNSSQYLVPRLTPSQRREAIEGPAHLFGWEVELALVDHLLEVSGERRDDLPLLQHLLLRTWEFAQANSKTKKRLTRTYADAVGGLQNALSLHADEVLRRLPKSKQVLTEKVFRTLTVTDAQNRQVRRPTTLEDLVAITGASRKEVSRVLEPWLDLQQFFLMKSADPEPRIDISHESLIRQWRRLAGWVEAEAESADTYRRLAEGAIRHEQGKQGPIVDPQLQIFRLWHQRQEPNLAWAAQYDPQPSQPRLNAAEAYLKLSRAASKQAERKEKRMAITLRVFLLISLAAGVLSFINWQEAKENSNMLQSFLLEAQSKRFLGVNDTLSLLFGLAAVRFHQTLSTEENLLHLLHSRKKSIRTFEGHFDWVWSIVFSPDGSRLASASSDSTIRLWDVDTGEILDTLCGHESYVLDATFSPDGSRLASASDDNTIRLWDTATGDILNTLRGHSGSVRGVAFGPDGSRLASASGDNTVRLWDTESGDVLMILRGHRDGVQGVAFSPDGSRLASASDDKTIRLWDTETGNSVDTLRGHSGIVRGVVFSYDGSRLASASGDNTIRLWDTATGDSLDTLWGHSKHVVSVAFSPDDSRLASASDDGTIRLWDISTGDMLTTLRGHNRFVLDVAFNPDGSRLASASADKMIHLWDSQVTDSLVFVMGKGAHKTVVTSVAFSPDGSRLASASSDSTIRLWDVDTGEILDTLCGHESYVLDATFSPDGSRLASASDDNTIRLWDTATGDILVTLRGHTGDVWGVAFSPDGSRLASASLDSTIRLWDIDTSEILDTLRGHNGSVRDVVFSPDGSRLASASSDNTVRLWDTETGNSVDILRGHSDWVRSVAFSPDGSRLASASDDKTIRLWDTETGNSVDILRGHSDWVRSVAFSPDGSRLASASDDNTIRLWDTATGDMLVTLRGHTGDVWGVAFSTDGSRLASGSIDYTISVWNVDSSVGVREACRVVGRNLTQREWNDYVGKGVAYVSGCTEYPRGK